MHKKKIQSHLIIESIQHTYIKGVFVSCFTPTSVFFPSFLFLLTLLELIFFTAEMATTKMCKKKKQKPQSHPFCELLIVTVIVTASS